MVLGSERARSLACCAFVLERWGRQEMVREGMLFLVAVWSRLFQLGRLALVLA